MSESEKPLGRACLVILLAMAMMTCKPGSGSMRQAFGSSPAKGHKATNAERIPALVDPENPTIILSQLRAGAYDSVPGKKPLSGQKWGSVSSGAPKNSLERHGNYLSIPDRNRAWPANDTDHRTVTTLAMWHAIRDQKQPLSPKQAFEDFTLTAYAVSPRDTGKQPGSPQYGITFSGAHATVGRTVAVDPHVIPIGTWLYIEGIGLRVAEDTGGAVKGHHIDVLMRNDDDALQFGVKHHVRIYTLARE